MCPQPRPGRVPPASPASSIAAVPLASSCRENRASVHPLECIWLEIVAVRARVKVLRPDIQIRRLRRFGGKLADLQHLGTGEAREHFPDPRIGFGGALALALREQVL